MNIFAIELAPPMVQDCRRDSKGESPPLYCSLSLASTCSILPHHAVAAAVGNRRKDTGAPHEYGLDAAGNRGALGGVRPLLDRSGSWTRKYLSHTAGRCRPRPGCSNCVVVSFGRRTAPRRGSGRLARGGKIHDRTRAGRAPESSICGARSVGRGAGRPFPGGAVFVAR